MTHTLMSTIAFVEAFYKGGKQRPKSILIRLSDTTSQSGAAYGVAKAWHSSRSKVDSCHFVVDSEHIFQCVDERRVAHSVPYGSQGTISINVCGLPTPFVDAWESPEYSTVLNRTAELVAELTSKYHIPVRDADLMQHRGWFSRGGIVVAVQGAWPGSTFLEKVNQFKN